MRGLDSRNLQRNCGIREFLFPGIQEKIGIHENSQNIIIVKTRKVENPENPLCHHGIGEKLTRKIQVNLEISQNLRKICEMHLKNSHLRDSQNFNP